VTQETVYEGPHPPTARGAGSIWFLPLVMSAYSNHTNADMPMLSTVVVYDARKLNSCEFAGEFLEENLQTVFRKITVF